MICSGGVGLRPVLEQDLQSLTRWRDNEFACPLYYSLALMSEWALRNWLRALLGDSSRMRFMVQVLDGQATVGIVGLEHIDYRNQSAELAGLIIDPEQRGRGLGTSAVGILLQYAFNDLNLHRVFARIHASNGPAQRVVAKAGLQSEGTARQCDFHNGAYVDVIYMSILREEWKHEHAVDLAVR